MTWRAMSARVYRAAASSVVRNARRSLYARATLPRSPSSAASFAALASASSDCKCSSRAQGAQASQLLGTLFIGGPLPVLKRR